VSLDTVDDNKAFAEKFNFPFALLCDTTGEMSRAYGATSSEKDAYPSRYTFVIGADGMIEQAIDTKSPGDQASELLNSFGS